MQLKKLPSSKYSMLENMCSYSNCLFCHQLFCITLNGFRYGSIVLALNELPNKIFELSNIILLIL